MARKQQVKAKKAVKACSALDILGVKKPEKSPTEIEPDCCVICNKELSDLRKKALRELKTPVNNWTCVKDSPVKRILGQYMGEVGTSEMKLVDRIEETSVRSMFRKSVVSEDDDDADPTDDT